MGMGNVPLPCSQGRYRAVRVSRVRDDLLLGNSAPANIASPDKGIVGPFRLGNKLAFSPEWFAEP